MSTYEIGFRLNGEEFGRDLFHHASEAWVAKVEAQPDLVGRLDLCFTFFREKGMAIDVEADGRGVGQSDTLGYVWRHAAKEGYRDAACYLLSQVLTHWKKRAPQGKGIFNKAIKETVPLACQALIFPEVFAVTPKQQRAILKLFDILAVLAGLRTQSAVDELVAACDG